ncbi:unnamed protein product [Brassica napus]|uniref:(rape) hypothetical protein n=1 Tax=Brassica napus TaxID=3708 RepID=A0A816PFI4_BRANA|nr:unnamed protein product [Brassica napus]
MMVKKKKKKQSRSTEKKTLEPKLLPIFHSKLASGKDMKHMIRGMSSIPVPGLSSQSRVFLQEPVDVTIYKCSGCDSILQAKSWEMENNDKKKKGRHLIKSSITGLLSSLGCMILTSDSHHLSSSDKGSGDRVCNVSTDAVKWETFEEDMGIKEEIRSISSKIIDLTFQPQWNHKLRAQASLLGDGEILVERMSDSTETDADRLVEPKEHVCETNLMSENTQEFDLGELKRQDIMGEKRGLLLEKSPYTGDSICDSKFYDLKLEAFQPWLNHKEDMESQNESCYEGVYGREDRAGLHLEEYETNYENYYSNPFEWTTPTFHVPEYEPEEGGQARSESSSFSDHEEEPWLVDYNKTKELQVVGVVVEDGPSLHFDKCGYESTTLEETLESTPKFYLHEPELLEPDNEADGSWESSSTGSFNSHESSKLRAVFHQEEEEPQVMSDSRTEMILGALLEPNDHVIPKEREMDHEEEDDDPWLVDDCETKALKVHVMAEDGASLHLEKFENEKMLLDQRVEPREDIFRLSLDDTVEEEWVTFDLETSQEDKEVNLRQTFKLGDTEENTPTPASASGSMLSEEEILRDQLEHFQKENEKSRRTSEVVGLRHALYQTQTSPLSTLPIDNPIGSPRHILMRSHMVSPLRSLTNSSGSLSDVLSLPKKT